MATDLDLTTFSDHDLLRLWKRTMVALRLRGVGRTRNIVGDVAERVAAAKLGLTLAGNSNCGHDATAPDGTTYEIKSRDDRLERARCKLGGLGSRLPPIRLPDRRWSSGHFGVQSQATAAVCRSPSARRTVYGQWYTVARTSKVNVAVTSSGTLPVFT
jgi:hypothetical protein